MVKLMWGPYSSQTHKDIEENCGCQGLREAMGELVFNGNRISVWEDEEFWVWMVLTAAQQCECASHY